MIEKVLEMWHAGFNPNQIAARLMIHKHIVEEIIAGRNMATPVVEAVKATPKKKGDAAAPKKLK